MKKLINILFVPAICILLAGCPEKESPVTSGRIIEKNHYLEGEYRECKKSIFPDDECELGDPVKFPERCTFVVEEAETLRKAEVEVGCDQTFENTVLGSWWVSPAPKK